MSASITLSRDVDAIQIPSGNHISLPSGTEVLITQQLGDSFTVYVTHQAGLFRIQSQDADALGREVPASATSDGPFSVERVWDQLRECYDPEIPVNIVDLGLVYDLRIEPQAGGQSRVEVRMTLTAPGCGMGQTIAMDARQRIENLPGVAAADVQVVWDPPWNPHMISPEGRAKLGME